MKISQGKISSRLGALATASASFAHKAPLLNAVISSSKTVSGGMELLKVVTPLVVTFKGIHSLSGATTNVIPQPGYTEHATAVVGQVFLWEFDTEGRHFARSFSSPTGLPADLNLSWDSAFFGKIDGIPTVAGVYEIGIKGWRFDGQSGQSTPTYTLSLTVQEAQPLETWRSMNFSSPQSIAAGDMADPDGDGMVNLLEYALDLNPNLSNAAPVSVIKQSLSSGQFIIYSYPLNAQATDVQPQFRRTSTLDGSDWVDILDTDNTFLVTRTPTLYQVRVPVDRQDFIQLVVTIK